MFWCSVPRRRQSSSLASAIPAHVLPPTTYQSHQRGRGIQLKCCLPIAFASGDTQLFCRLFDGAPVFFFSPMPLSCHAVVRLLTSFIHARTQSRNHAIIVGLASDSVKLLTYTKKEDPKGFFDQICSAIKASNGGKKVGMFTGKSDEYTGSLVEGFLSAIDAAGSYKNKQTKGSTLDPSHRRRKDLYPFVTFGSLLLIAVHSTHHCHLRLVDAQATSQYHHDALL